MNRVELLRKLPQGGHCVEVGVESGDFANMIYNTIKPSHLWLVDSWQHYTSKVYGGDCTNVSQPEQDKKFQAVVNRFAKHDNVSVHRKTSVEAATEFAENSLDFVYIDACHAYGHALVDMVLWWTRVKPGGFLSGHDYQKGHQHIQVIEAVTDFCEIFKVTVQVDPKELFASWLIQKPISLAGPQPCMPSPLTLL